MGFFKQKKNPIILNGAYYTKINNFRIIGAVVIISGIVALIVLWPKDSSDEATTMAPTTMEPDASTRVLYPLDYFTENVGVACTGRNDGDETNGSGWSNISAEECTVHCNSDRWYGNSYTCPKAYRRDVSTSFPPHIGYSQGKK